ncbi:NACHT domain-containing protein [Streptomyces phaeochromogenes]
MTEPITAGVASALGRAAGRALGPVLMGGVRGVRERRSLQQRITKTSFRGAAQIDVALQRLTPAARAKITEFTGSAEFENVCFQVALAARMPGKPEKHLADLKRVFNESLRLYRGLHDETLTPVADALFAEITAVAWEEVGRRAMQKSVAHFSITPEIMASHISAAARNASLHQDLSTLADIDDFANRLSRQCSRIHGKMRPAQIESGIKIPIEKLYVQPKIICAREDESQDSEGSSHVDVRQSLINSHRVVILGDPGGGKTTLAVKLMVDIARGKGIGPSAQVPLRVVLRDFADSFKSRQESIVKFLEKQSESDYSVTPPTSAIDYLLLNGRAVVIFDGMDELTDTSLRSRVVDAVEAFAHAYPTTPILATSRRVGYDMAPLDEELFETFFLSPFDDEQKNSYVIKWFDCMRQDSAENRRRYAERFLIESEHASDISRNALMLGLMCALYRGEGYIPRNRPDLYRRCSEFLFERWDSSRGILVAQPFERGIQFALFSLALNIMNSSDSHTGLAEKRLVKFASDFLLDQQYEDRDSADAAARAFVEFCRGRAWVLTDVGTQADGERLYSFTHRTFLEYFSARQLVRSHSDARQLYESLRNRLKEESWDVVAQLAVQFLDERLENAANDFVLHALSESDAATGGGEKIPLVSFCARLMEFVVLRPAVVRRVVASLSRLEFQGADAKLLDAAWRNVTACAAEVRHAASGELSNQLRLEPQSRNLLFVNMTTSELISHAAPREVKEYWVMREKAVAVEFRELLRDRATYDRSIAILAYMHGVIGIAELVEMHDPEIIVETRSHHRRGYYHILTEVAFFGGPRSHVDVPEGRPGGMAKELADFMMKLEMPIAEAVSFTAYSPSVSARFEEAPDENFLRILNWCLEVENTQSVESYTPEEVGDAFLRNLANSRLTNTPPASTLKHIYIPERYMVYLRKWASREVSLLRR